MLSIKTYSVINRNYTFSSGKTVPFKGEDVTELLEQGDKALNENRPEDALNIYIQAKNKNPDNIIVYRKLGKAFLNIKSYKSAQDNYKKYLDEAPNDSDAWIDYGDALRKDGLYKNSITAYEKAIEIDKGNDLAKRNIMEAKNSLLAVYSPQKARIEKDLYASENLKKALQITADYLSNNNLNNIPSDWTATIVISSIILNFLGILYFVILFTTKNNPFLILFNTLKFFILNIFKCILIIIFLLFIHMLISFTIFQLGFNITLSLILFFILFPMYLNYSVILVFCFYNEKNNRNNRP